MAPEDSDDSDDSDDMYYEYEERIAAMNDPSGARAVPQLQARYSRPEVAEQRGVSLALPSAALSASAASFVPAHLRVTLFNEEIHPPTIECPLCLTNIKDIRFNCGHLSCAECANKITNCHTCRALIITKDRIKYDEENMSLADTKTIKLNCGHLVNDEEAKQSTCPMCRTPITRRDRLYYNKYLKYKTKYLQLKNQMK
jgi:hypothetical protein